MGTLIEYIRQMAMIDAANYCGALEGPCYDKSFYDGYITSAKKYYIPVLKKAREEYEERVFRMEENIAQHGEDEAYWLNRDMAVQVKVLIEIFGKDVLDGPDVDEVN